MKRIISIALLLGLIITAPSYGTISIPINDPATGTNQTSEITQLTAIANNTASALNDVTLTGNITAQCTNAQINACPANSTVTANAEGAYTITISTTGTFSATLVVDAQFADNTWATLVPVFQQAVNGVANTVPYPVVYSYSLPSQVLVTGGGFLNVRVRALTYTSGTAAIGMDASVAQQTVFAAQLGPYTVNTKNSLTANAPGTVTVGVASGTIVAANAARKGLVIHNNSINIIYLAFGATAVVGSGITLYPGGAFYMDEYSFSTAAVNGIASAASSVEAHQEFQ